jgi:ADP-heptose:LPS heptosyltransferase
MMFKRRAGETVESILVIKFFGLGSILLATPALRLLRIQFPDARVIFLSFSSNLELVEKIPMIDERWLIDAQTPGSFIKSFGVIVSRLVTAKIDVVLDLEFFSKFSTFIGAIARPGKHIGFALPTRWRSWNLTDSISLKNDRHVSKTFLSAVAPLGIDGSDFVLPRIRIDETANRAFPGLPAASPHDQIICVDANAGETSLDRRWGGDCFARTIDILQLDNPDSIFCFIGSAGERAYVEGVVEKMISRSTRIVNLAGQLTLNELLALFSRARLLITNDSGPMHIAAAVGLSTVALFGPESPEFYGPLGNKSINLFASLPCSPCLNMYNAKVFRCPINAQCMRDISVEQVVDAARVLLRKDVSKETLVEEAS